MKKILIGFMLALSALQAVQAQKLPCSAAPYRQFDFWLGEWEAFGLNGQKAGDSKISLMLDSCTLLEEWTAAGNQQGFRYAGKSYNMYNAATKKWQQYWVDNAGGITEYFNGHFTEGKMILQTANTKVNDTMWQLQKMTFYNIGPDKVRQHGENSNDNGKTWVTSFDLEYRRKSNSPATIANTLLRKMEQAYNKGDFAGIAAFYTVNAKVVGKNTLISAQEQLKTYWQGFAGLGGTWTLSHETAEQMGDLIWQKGKSVINDKNGKEHTVNFTLILTREQGEWKILQDAYW
jgi:ketosteroid isomerase-like protein